jgi:hypothetical protein
LLRLNHQRYPVEHEPYYDLGSYGADGDFGWYTDKAVKAFQGVHLSGLAGNPRLSVDGIVGKNTWSALEWWRLNPKAHNSYWDAYKKPAGPPAPVASPSKTNRSYANYHDSGWSRFHSAYFPTLDAPGWIITGTVNFPLRLQVVFESWTNGKKSANVKWGFESNGGHEGMDITGHVNLLSKAGSILKRTDQKRWTDRGVYRKRYFGWKRYYTSQPVYSARLIITHIADGSSAAAPGDPGIPTTNCLVVSR